MATIIPNSGNFGATIEGIDLSLPLSAADFRLILYAFGEHCALRFPNQRLDAAQQKAFGARFGSLEINVASGSFQEPGHPELMVLSNIVENGVPLGLKDAGQDWHTDMCYSRTIAFLNVLYGIKIPFRNGKPLGATMLADMRTAYDDLPSEMKERIAGMTATHDFNKFWEMMRQRPGSGRKPLSAEQRREKPPVSHPVVLTHPISGRKILYCSVGHVTHIDGLPEKESDEILSYLFKHQLNPKYQYSHNWSVGDVLVWDNISTLHNAVADYGPNEHRLLKRCQVMADWVMTAPEVRDLAHAGQPSRGAA